MGWTFVQSFATDDIGGTAGTTDSANAGVGITAGNGLFAYAKHESAATAIQVACGASTFLPLTKTTHGNGALHGQWHWLSSAPAGQSAVDIILGAARDFISLIVFEYSYTGGVPTFDVETGNAATGSSMSSGNITTTGADELVLCGYSEFSTQFPSNEQINSLAAEQIQDVPNVNNYTSAWARRFGSIFTGQGTASLGLPSDYILRLAAFKLVAAAATNESDIGSRRLRVGRGPYSLGRYFRPRIDAITSVSLAAIGGNFSATEDQDIAAIAGEVDVTGDLAATEAQDVAAISGEVDVTGDLIATEAQDTAGISGEVPVSGDVVITEAADIAAIAGEVDVTGDLVATEGPDIAAISGEVDVTGDLAVTEQQDTAAIDGQVIVAGDLAATEAQDTAAISGEVDVQGDLIATEEQDIAFMNGTNDVTGTLSATEAQDVTAISGQVLVSGTLSATELQDTAALAGEVDVTGDLSVTESSDITSISGTVEQPLEPIEGVLAATDSQDTTTVTGTVEQARTGNMAATEARDLCVIFGDVAELLGDLIPRSNLPYMTREAAKFGVFNGRFKNVERVRVSTKNGIAPVDFIENVETSVPKSIIPDGVSEE